MATITRSSQTASQQLQSALDGHIHDILQVAIDQETAPLKKEIEAHRVLVNETVEKARLDNETARKALSDKENELNGAKARIAELENDLTSARAQVTERDQTITDLKEKAKAAAAAETAPANG